MLDPLICGLLTNLCADRNVHIHCDREGHSAEVAHQAEELESGDFEVGFIWRSSGLITPINTWIGILLFTQQTIKFINDDASSVHGALRVGSIYTSESGEWRVGGFEVLSSMKDDEAVIYVRLKCACMVLGVLTAL